MCFIEFLRGVEGNVPSQPGFLSDALTDKNFPDIQNWDHLNVYLILRRANAKTREEAMWYWAEYQNSQTGP
jgi:hypothetical protein